MDTRTETLEQEQRKEYVERKRWVFFGLPFGLGTVACYTGDNTHPQLFLSHIRNAREIKNYILKASEEARRKRRTLNTLNINASDADEMDE